LTEVLHGRGVYRRALCSDFEKPREVTPKLIE